MDDEHPSYERDLTGAAITGSAAHAITAFSYAAATWYIHLTSTAPSASSPGRRRNGRRAVRVARGGDEDGTSTDFMGRPPGFIIYYILYNIYYIIHIIQYIYIYIYIYIL